MQGPSAAANIPQPDTLSSPPLALREAPRRAGSAPNVRREIQRVQSLIGLRWCVFFMRSPGGGCLRTASFRQGAGLLARSKRAQFVPQVNLFLRHVHFQFAGRIGILPGLISLAPVVRSHVPQPISTTRRAPVCAAGSPKPSLPGAAPGLRAIFTKMEAVVYQLALQAVNLPERVRTPSVSPSFSTGR